MSIAETLAQEMLTTPCDCDNQEQYPINCGTISIDLYDEFDYNNSKPLNGRYGYPAENTPYRLVFLTENDNEYIMRNKKTSVHAPKKQSQIFPLRRYEFKLKKGKYILLGVIIGFCGRQQYSVNEWGGGDLNTYPIDLKAQFFSEGDDITRHYTPCIALANRDWGTRMRSNFTAYLEIKSDSKISLGGGYSDHFSDSMSDDLPYFGGVECTVLRVGD